MKRTKDQYMKLTRGLDAKEVVAKFKAGASKQSIATEFGCTTRTINRVLLTAGAMKYEHKMSDKMLALHRKGMSNVDIARKLKVGATAVSMVIRAEKNTSPTGMPR